MLKDYAVQLERRDRYDLARRCGAVLVAVLLALVLAFPAGAQVVWEDFQGNSSMLGTSNQDLAGPNYTNNSGSSATNLANLRAIAADPAKAVRTGTSATVDYSAASGTLCNTSNPAGGYDPAGTGSSCMADAQGRVMYALIKFPYTGNFSFAAAHDDEVDMDLSSDFTNTNYRNAVYDIPVGNVGSWTSNDTTYDALTGIFSSPANNACVLVRIYWNNAGGINFLRLRWTRPNASGTGTTTEIVPSAYLLDPASASSSVGCAGTVTTTATSLLLNKAVGSTGRASSSDQFTVTITQNSNGAYQASATTAGSGTGQQASTGAVNIVNGTVYRLTDSMAAGSTNTLSAAYTPSIACTRAGAAYTPTSVSTGVWTVSTSAANQKIVCTITNTRRTALLRVRKTWVNAAIGNAVTLPASTGFVTNTSDFNSSAGTANESDTSGTFTVQVGDSGTLKAESFTNGSASSYLSALSCSTGTLSGTNGKQDNTFTIPVAAAGTTITCTYTNTWQPISLDVVKSSSVLSDGINAINPKAIPGATIRYCILISNSGQQAIGSVVATDAMPAGLTYVPGSMSSSTSCTGSLTGEDDDASDAGESDPVSASVSGTTITANASALAVGASFALVFSAVTN